MKKQLLNGSIKGISTLCLLVGGGFLINGSETKDYGEVGIGVLVALVGVGLVVLVEYLRKKDIVVSAQK